MENPTEFDKAIDEVKRLHKEQAQKIIDKDVVIRAQEKERDKLIKKSDSDRERLREIMEVVTRRYRE